MPPKALIVLSTLVIAGCETVPNKPPVVPSASPAAAVSPVTARTLCTELHLDDSKWRLLNESPNSISWLDEKTELAITLNYMPGLNATFPPPTDLNRLRAGYRQEALSYRGGLVEAEPKWIGGIYGNLVTMKFPRGIFQNPPDSRPGFNYQMNALIPTTEGRYVLQIAGLETGTTGIREAIGIIIFMKRSGISDLTAAAEAFRRDPYDHAFDKDALFNVCDEREYDSAMPDHPLSRCRAEMDRLLGTLVISDRIRGIAQFKDAKEPVKPATMPRAYSPPTAATGSSLSPPTPSKAPAKPA